VFELVGVYTFIDVAIVVMAERAVPLGREAVRVAMR
jgi:hypothetical protein